MKYFGTDGFRGEANVGLTVEHAYKIGRFVGWYYGANRERKARVIVGKDTRRSSYMFEAALVSGLVASGADAYMLHVIPTPGVAHQTVEGCFDCGIMISASHNPFCDNGIKLVNSDGFKMDEDVLELIEDYIDGKSEVPLATGNHIGATVDYMQGRNRYIASLIASANFSLQGVKIGIDCANGSASSVAKPVFDALGADVRVINAAPDGFNINVDCGSTHMERLQRHVVEQGLDVGFAYDGDADRCLAVDERGRVVDGDQILYVCGVYLNKHGRPFGRYRGADDRQQLWPDQVAGACRPECRDQRRGRPSRVCQDARGRLQPGWRADGPYDLWRYRAHGRRHYDLAARDGSDSCRARDALAAHGSVQAVAAGAGCRARGG